MEKSIGCYKFTVVTTRLISYNCRCLARLGCPRLDGQLHSTSYYYGNLRQSRFKPQLTR